MHVFANPVTYISSMEPYQLGHIRAVEYRWAIRIVPGFRDYLCYDRLKALPSLVYRRHRMDKILVCSCIR